MKFEIILNLVGSTTNSKLADKPIFVFDHKDRKLTELKFYDGYSITEDSKNALKKFSENCNENNITYFIVKFLQDSIIIYDHNHNFLLSLARAS
jgi:hypothetical protein